MSIFLFLLNGCSSKVDPAPLASAPVPKAEAPRTKTAPATVNIFDNYMKTESAPADGFDFPFGDANGNGWRLTAKFAEESSSGIHQGENWSSNRSSGAALGQQVYSVANGRVIFAGDGGNLSGKVIIIEHIFYENNEKKKIQSLYAHLSNIKVQIGDEVKRRQQIAAIAQSPENPNESHLYLEFRSNDTLTPNYQAFADGKDQIWIKKHFVAPGDFILRHRKLFVPQQESTLVLVDQANHKMRLYKNNELQKEYEVSFGQSKGPKQVEGDNKTPKGMYFVIQKHQGEFDGPYGKYYGGYWIKVNYPNRYDADRGVKNKLITVQQEAQIKTSWEKRAPTLENTRLGGGIGFHGWIQEWSDDSTRERSWGCVVMHIYDIKKLFEQIPEGSMVVIF